MCVVLLYLCSVAVVWLLVFCISLAVPLVGHQFVIVAFPGHTQLHFSPL